jgi:hypothetical protein
MRRTWISSKTGQGPQYSSLTATIVRVDSLLSCSGSSRELPPRMKNCSSRDLIRKCRIAILGVFPLSDSSFLETTGSWARRRQARGDARLDARSAECVREFATVKADKARPSLRIGLLHIALRQHSNSLDGSAIPGWFALRTDVAC